MQVMVIMTSAVNSTTVTCKGRTAILVCHTAILSGRYRRNTAAAMRECFQAKADRIEIDIHSLDGDDYVVFHERRLQAETTGDGSLGRVTPDAIRAVRWLDDPDDRPPLLSEVVEMARDCDTELQLDLKDWRPMPAGRIAALLRTIAPIHDRAIISCGQDWNLRRLREADGSLAFGFDPGHYFDYEEESSPVFLPRAMGAYGYRDAHPLGLGRTEPVEEYLHERMSILRLQVPGAREFFLDHHLILRMLDDGFDAVAWLHDHEIEVTAWTPDYHDDTSLVVLDRLLAAGVDRITTNTTPAWQAAVASTEDNH